MIYYIKAITIINIVNIKLDNFPIRTKLSKNDLYKNNNNLIP
jgi:hypothetical protein